MIRRNLRNFLIVCFVLLSVSFVHAQEFSPARPSKFNNESPERRFEAGNLTVRSFTNPVTFSCYAHVIKSEGGNIIVDPGYYDGDLKEYIKSIGGVDTVLLSHCHVDHIIGLNALKKDYPNAKIYIGASDLEGLYNIDINYSFERVISEPFVIECEVLPAYAGTYKFAGQSVKVIPSQGHSPGSSLYYFEEAKLLFVGDTIAFGGIPRYDVPNSNVPELFETLMRVKTLGISDSTEVFFGHGEHMNYRDMLNSYAIFTKPLRLSAKTQDGNLCPINNYYFDDKILMISLEEIVSITGIAYFGNSDGAVAYIPQFGRLKVRAGSPEAEIDTFSINMKGSAQIKDGKIYLPGKFIAEIFRPFLKWELKVAPDVVTLSYSDHEPLGNMRTKFLNDVLFPAIERESKGHIKIIPHWNGELSISYKALPTVQEAKTAQIAVVVPEYFGDAFPLQQIFKSFPVGPTGQAQVNFFRSIYDKIPALKDEIEKQNLHVIFIATGYPASFFSHEPLKNLHDISGQKWRSASFWHKDFLKNAGAIPITMPWGKQVFDALADGSLDGLIVNIDSGYDIKAHTEAKYIAVSPKLWLGHAYPIAMNKDIWNSLSDNDRKAIERAANYSYERLGAVMDSALPEQIRVLQSEGAVVRIMSDEEVSEWERITNYRSIQDNWAKMHSGTHEVIDAVRINLQSAMK